MTTFCSAGMMAVVWLAACCVEMADAGINTKIITTTLKENDKAAEIAAMMEEIAGFEVFPTERYHEVAFRPRRLEEGGFDRLNGEPIPDVECNNGYTQYRIDAVTNQAVAIKRLRFLQPQKLTCSRNYLKDYLNEIAALEAMKGVPACQQLVGKYRSGTDLNEAYIVTNLVGYQSVADNIQFLTKQTLLTEKQLCKNIGRLLKVIWYMWRVGIIHRDLRVENLILDMNDNLFVINFGIAKFVNPRTGEAVNTGGCYTIMPPEALAGKPCDHRQDLWSVALILYMWIDETLIPPFYDCTENCKHGEDRREKVIEHIHNQQILISGGVPELISDLIKKIIVPVENRPTVDDLMFHPWFKQFNVTFPDLDGIREPYVPPVLFNSALPPKLPKHKRTDSLLKESRRHKHSRPLNVVADANAHLAAPDDIWLVVPTDDSAGNSSDSSAYGAPVHKPRPRQKTIRPRPGQNSSPKQMPTTSVFNRTNVDYPPKHNDIQPSSADNRRTKLKTTNISPDAAVALRGKKGPIQPMSLNHSLIKENTDRQRDGRGRTVMAGSPSTRSSSSTRRSQSRQRNV